ncbi:threonine--tRNA ligase [Candidatus Parcubacteria bacterium]|nr:threonine--tRNA ligase [Candidatus Parcubacteria bacterium]
MNKQNENLNVKRHSLAHVLAAAIKELYPNTLMAIGPSVDNGFYYDFDFGDEKIGDDDLKKIEKKMIHILKQNIEFKRRVVNINDAIKKEKDAGQIYKVELLQDLKMKAKNSGEKLEIGYYSNGNFEDLCCGPHIKETKEIAKGSFKIVKIAGAYWKGDKKNKMLTRIYGYAFENKEELDDYLKKVKEAEARDHRKLGKELDLFCFSNLVGPGLPLFTPKGVVIKDELQKRVEEICREYGFEKVSTPHLAKIDLYELSGHAKKFGDELFHVKSHYKQDYVLKPVQCPHQTQIYASRPRSYRDLPIRYMESEKQYRDEKPGQISGLERVIAITVEDGHTFCTVDQVKDEVKNMVNIIKDFYTSLGMWDNHWVSLSVRDYDNPEKYIGEPEDWDKCEKMLEEVAQEMGLEAKRCEGEAALYGPKLDFMFRDSIGKEIQIPTVQLDFATPKRFNLIYTDQNNKEVNPVMVHRAILGSYERFMMLLIEHFAGAFPVWLSPVQVQIISVGESHREHCNDLALEFKNQDIRVEVDNNDETVGNKIRKATGQKVPYVLVIGDKEMNSKNLEVRNRGSKETRSIKKLDFIKEIKEKIKNK